MRKNITALLTTSLILAAFLGSAFYMSIVKANGDSTDWYMTVNGVLTSDTYSLYPYQQKSIDVSFSKFGELINYDWDTEIGVGLQYLGYESIGTYDQTKDTSADPFYNEYVDSVWWMNGWFIDIKYRLPTGDWREIWAMAQFSDSKKAGGDWITMPEVTAGNIARPPWQEYAPYANPDADAYSPSKGDASKTH